MNAVDGPSVAEVSRQKLFQGPVAAVPTAPVGVGPVVPVAPVAGVGVGVNTSSPYSADKVTRCTVRLADSGSCSMTSYAMSSGDTPREKWRTSALNGMSVRSRKTPAPDAP